MWQRLKRFDLDTFSRAIVAVGIIILVGLTLFLLIPQQPVLIPVVVTALLSLLSAVVYYFFPRKG